MIEEYYKRISALTSSPEVLDAMSDDNKARLKGALEGIQTKLNDSDDEINGAIENFINVFNDLELEKMLEDAVKNRSIMPKAETRLPREILNDLTIMTLKML